MTRGTIRVRRHCTFRWWRADRWWADAEQQKTVEVEPQHCQTCIAALQKLEFGELVVSRPRPIASVATESSAAI